MALRTERLDLFADYFQLYVMDVAVTGDTGSVWTAEAVDRMLGTGPGFVAIGTARNMTVPVTVEVGDGEPADDSAAWQRVVRCGLDVAGDGVRIFGCTDYVANAAFFPLSSGRYGVRVSYAGLDDLSEDELDGNDRYRIQLWPGSVDGITVVKR